MTDQDPHVADPARRGGFLRRHVALIAGTATLVTAGALGYAALQQPTYTAHARVLVEALTVPTATARTPDMGTEQAVVTSSAILVPAAAALDLPVSTVQHAVAVSVPVTANVLDIGYSASNSTLARNGATAVANAYMSYRARTNASNLGAESPEALGVPGVQARLITPATRPARPSSPDVVIDVLAVLVVGLVTGTALAFAVDRFGQRLRSMTRWQDVVGVPVLVGLPTNVLVDTSGRNGAKGAGADGAVALRYVRRRTAHMLPTRGAVLLVTEVRAQTERVALARQLTSAFIDSGRNALLIELTQDHPSPQADAKRTWMNGDLRVRVTLAPELGSEPGPVGEWHAVTVDGLLRMIEEHRMRYDLVVVTAPSVTHAITGLDVAAVADEAVLIDHVGSARRTEAIRAVAELRAAGCRLGGCVLVGVGRTRVGDAPPPAPRADARGLDGGHRRTNRRNRPVTFTTNFDDPARAETARHDTANGSRKP
jgi:capsular polysaccharide biosynthesis protein